MIRRSSLLAFIAAFFFASSLHAQSAVYGGVASVNYCFNLTNGNNVACKSDTYGFTVGVTHLFSSSDRLHFGVDARFDGSPGGNGGEAALVSGCFVFVPRTHAISPYFQIGGGIISSTYLSPVCTTNGFTTVCNANTSRRSGGAVDLALGFTIRTGTHLYARPLEIMSSAGPNVGHVALSTAFGYTF